MRPGILKSSTNGWARNGFVHLWMGGAAGHRGARCHPISLEGGRSRIGRYLVQAFQGIWRHLEVAGDTKMDRATRSCGKRIYLARDLAFDIHCAKIAPAARYFFERDILFKGGIWQLMTNHIQGFCSNSWGFTLWWSKIIENPLTNTKSYSNHHIPMLCDPKKRSKKTPLFPHPRDGGLDWSGRLEAPGRDRTRQGLGKQFRHVAMCHEWVYLRAISCHIMSDYIIIYIYIEIYRYRYMMIYVCVIQASSSSYLSDG